MNTVFISATSIDLKQYILALKDSLEDAGYHVLTMKNFGAQPDEPRQVSLMEVEKADYVVGLYGRRYGYVPENQACSITEQEYHHARQKQKPVFAFLVDEANRDLEPGPGEDDGSDAAAGKQQQLKSFLSHIETALVRETFFGKEDLPAKVLASLSRYEKRKTVQQGPAETLRIHLGENGCALYHNDQPMGGSQASFDAAWRHALEAYRQAKPTTAAKAPPGQGSGAFEIQADQMGRRLGEVVFCGDAAQSARELISRWRTSGARAQLALNAIAAPWTALPLETMIVPGADAPLALTPHLDTFRMGRDQGETVCPDIDGPLKVLMAVAVPWEGRTGAVLDYEQELGKVMDIAEQLPDFTDEERRPIVHILDQGTLDDICDAFGRNRYHILHISCHGEPGALHLEKEDGTVHRVEMKEMIDRFPAGRQPVLTVLSACHTGAAGELTSFAEYLVENGFTYVVAMQDSISDRCATLFAEALYNALAYNEHPVIEAAFTLARLRIEKERLARNKTLSPEQRLAPEWMIPALYKGGVERHVIFEPRKERYDRHMETPVEDFDPGVSHRQIGEFVGRRRELLALKHQVLAAKKGGAALITGMGGVGKSTLAARALADTIRKGRPFHLVPVIGRVSLVDLLQGLGCRGRELEQLSAYFFDTWLPEKGNDTVFLFDNFEENLFALDALASGPLNDTVSFEIQDAAVARFLADLIYAGKTRTLITCRYPFKLPDRQHRRLQTIELGALSPAETRKLMLRLTGFESLEPKERHQVAQYIGGHPRTLEFADAILRDGRFTYPDVEGRLLKKLPDDALHRIKKHQDLSSNLREAVAVAARDCLVDQLLELLSPTEKALLFLLSVFREPRPADTVAWLADKQGLEVNAKEAAAKLARLSLVSAYKDGLAVHRWTAEYLKEIMGEARWREANHLAGDHYYAPEKIALDDAFSAWQHYLKSADLEKAHEVAGGLEDKLDIWGLWDLRRIVCETMLEHTADHLAIHAGWLHTTGNLNYVQGDYDGAREQYKKSLEISEKLGDLGGMAAGYHQLGMIQQAQGDYDGAREQYKKSFEIREKLGDLGGMAATYHHLGIIQQAQGDYDGAREQYKKSLEIKEKLGDLRGMATTYHHLGIIQQDQGDYDGAREQYKKSLEIFEKLGDLRGMAATYHHLGMIQQAQGDYDGARDQYKKSLEIKEKLGDLRGMATTYHQLGIIQQAQGDYDGAREQYKRSIEIREKLGDLSGMADSYGQLGLFMRQNERHSEAFGYFLQAFLIFVRLQTPAAQQALGDLCEVARENPDQWQQWLAELVEDEEARSQVETLILERMQSEQDQMAAHLQEMKAHYDRMGEKAFLEEFKKQTGNDVPDELLEYLRSETADPDGDGD